MEPPVGVRRDSGVDTALPPDEAMELIDEDDDDLDLQRKLNRPKTCNFIKKETLAQVFSCEFREISKNILFYRTPLGNCFCL